MISLHTQGGNRFQKNLVNVTVSWCLQKMMPRIRKLDLHFHLKNIKDADGFCLNDSADQEDFGPNRSPRRFCIEIKKSLHLTDMVSTIIHEMEHVRQYVMLELEDTSTHARWKTRKYAYDHDYWKQPWEKMAYAKQEKYIMECLAEAVFDPDPDQNGFTKHP